MRPVLVGTTLAFVAACSGADARTSATTIDASGDTIVARTPASPGEASVPLVREIAIGQSDGPPEYSFSTISEIAVGRDGQIYVWDQTERALRLYDAQGKFVRQIGRTGSGPGEYDRINGITVRADGKLAVWDAGNARINVYSPAGDYETAWTVTSGFFTGRALTSDTANNIYMRATVKRDSTQPFGTPGFIRLSADGKARDSLVPPQIGPAPRALTAAKLGAAVSYGIPYLPSRQWAMSPHGYFVAGPGAPYVLYALPAAGKPLKIEREYTPVAVDPADKSERREGVLYGMRRTLPDYQWDGPDIPDQKPAYQSLTVDRDGRIWVSVSLPSEKIPESEQVVPEPTSKSGGAGEPPAPPPPPRRGAPP